VKLSLKIFIPQLSTHINAYKSMLTCQTNIKLCWKFYLQKPDFNKLGKHRFPLQLKCFNLIHETDLRSYKYLLHCFNASKL